MVLAQKKPFTTMCFYAPNDCHHFLDRMYVSHCNQIRFLEVLPANPNHWRVFLILNPLPAVLIPHPFHPIKSIMKTMYSLRGMKLSCDVVEICLSIGNLFGLVAFKKWQESSQSFDIVSIRHPVIPIRRFDLCHQRLFHHCDYLSKDQVTLSSEASSVDLSRYSICAGAYTIGAIKYSILVAKSARVLPGYMKNPV
jgi:hypothetical protein